MSQPDTIFPYYMWNKHQEAFFTGGPVEVVNRNKPFETYDPVMDPEKEMVGLE